MKTGEPITHPGTTARNVVLARRTFYQQYVGIGRGFFDPENPDAAEHLFDSLCEEGAFTSEWLARQADIAEQESY